MGGEFTEEDTSNGATLISRFVEQQSRDRDVSFHPRLMR